MSECKKEACTCGSQLKTVATKQLQKEVEEELKQKENKSIAKVLEGDNADS